MAMTNRKIPEPEEPTALAFTTSGIPVLEGEAARRFIREAKANEKKRGTRPLSEESKASYQAFKERGIKEGWWIWG